MAGNIIPAIATTNAVIAGIIVLQAFMILNGRIDECKNVNNNDNVQFTIKLSAIVIPGVQLPWKKQFDPK